MCEYQQREDELPEAEQTPQRPDSSPENRKRN
jgi:hypothetical protein